MFEPGFGQVAPSVDMSISGEADLDQMLSMYEGFLQATGYQLENKTLKLDGPDTLTVDQNGFINFSDYPLASGGNVDFIGWGGK